ncbi:hypothetical protein GCM10010353_66870 [Streptomyces chryseus]|nr:hypothetical protein GCM10010353_66870 [Streptomyces chryseus]
MGAASAEAAPGSDRRPPPRKAADAREQEEFRARQEEYKAQVRRAAEQKAAEREARRPPCATCGAKFTDDRWTAAEAYPKPAPRWHGGRARARIGQPDADSWAVPGGRVLHEHP